MCAVDLCRYVKVVESEGSREDRVVACTRLTEVSPESRGESEAVATSSAETNGRVPNFPAERASADPGGSPHCVHMKRVHIPIPTPKNRLLNLRFGVLTNLPNILHIFF